MAVASTRKCHPGLSVRVTCVSLAWRHERASPRAAGAPSPPGPAGRGSGVGGPRSIDNCACEQVAREWPELLVDPGMPSCCAAKCTSDQGCLAATGCGSVRLAMAPELYRHLPAPANLMPLRT